MMKVIWKIPIQPLPQQSGTFYSFSQVHRSNLEQNREYPLGYLLDNLNLANRESMLIVFRWESTL